MAHSASAAYRQTLDFLYTRLPMFSRIGAAALKADLSNTLALCAVLGNPEKRFRSIHIAGSNGKGSTSHILAAIFQESGYKTGLYTSPHLVDFRERIRIDGHMVSQDFVVDFVQRHRAEIERIQPSFFEITVAMAFTAFAAAGVDIAVIETGLGGRLDSTNVILPELSIITNISLEHTELLGSSIPEIAREKAGVIKPGIPVVIGEENDAAMAVFEAAAHEKKASLRKAYSCWKVTQREEQFHANQPETGQELILECALGGSYQQANLATVLTVVDALREQGWVLPEAALRTALKEVKILTGLRGRWDIWQHTPLILADVAHNPAGLAVVMRDWGKVPAREKHILIGFVRDKDVRQALSLFPKNAPLHFCAARIPRALPAGELSEIAADLGLRGEVHASVGDALRDIRTRLQPEDALLITGSFFVVGEAMEAYELSDDK